MIDLSDAGRINRYHQALENAKARLARCKAMNDQHGIGYNERRIVKLNKLISEPLKPLGPSIPWNQQLP